MAGLTLLEKNTRYFYGGDGFVIDLTPLIRGNPTLTSSAQVNQRRIYSAAKVGSYTADGLSVRHGFAVTLLAGAEADKVLANPSGFVWIEQHDNDMGFVFPAAVRSVATNVPIGNIVKPVVFYSTPAGAAVEDTLITSGTASVSSTTLTYVRKTGDIELLASSYSLKSNEAAVKGAPYRAEGVTG